VSAWITTLTRICIISRSCMLPHEGNGACIASTSSDHPAVRASDALATCASSNAASETEGVQTSAAQGSSAQNATLTSCFPGYTTIFMLIMMISLTHLTLSSLCCNSGTIELLLAVIVRAPHLHSPELVYRMNVQPGVAKHWSTHSWVLATVGAAGPRVTLRIAHPAVHQQCHGRWMLPVVQRQQLPRYK
jgi:hypothetical protein